MTADCLTLAIIEDNPGDRRLLKEMLGESSPQTMKIIEAGSLVEVERKLARSPIDLALLDLGLPESTGLDTFLRFTELCPDTAVIVLTGLSDERVALATIQRGAQDYLIKGEFDARLLAKSMSYSIERHRLNKALDEQKRKEQQLRELTSLRRIAESGQASVAAASLGIERLKNTSAHAFEGLVDEALALTGQGLEQRAVKTDISVSNQIRDLAATLGRLHAGPKDIIDIYRAVLRRLSDNTNPARANAMTEEARYVTLELMGYLANYYRDMAGGQMLVPAQENCLIEKPDTEGQESI